MSKSTTSSAPAETVTDPAKDEATLPPDAVEDAVTVEAEPETIFVKTAQSKTEDDGTDVVVFERDERHPDGEAFIANHRVHEVFPTAAVIDAIGKGLLLKASKADFDAQTKADKAKAKATKEEKE